VGLWRSLGARFHGMEEVVGSIPTRSTKSLNNLEAPLVDGDSHSLQSAWAGNTLFMESLMIQ
jgi:hypothetical protein